VADVRLSEDVDVECPRTDETLSSVEYLLERDIILSATNLGVLPKFTEVSRTTAVKLARSQQYVSCTHLSHRIVTMRWPGPSIFAIASVATPAVSQS
jgi:hypothetical protein